MTEKDLRPSAGLETREDMLVQADQLTEVVDNLEEGILTVDHQGRLSYLNPAAVRLTGWSYEEAYGHPIEEVCPLTMSPNRRTILHPLRRALELRHEVRPEEKHILTSSRAREVVVDVRALPLGRTLRGDPGGGALICHLASTPTGLDATTLWREEKRRSLGLLAGGVAHDFNNLLTPILGYASLARTLVPSSSPVHAMLEEIEQAATRAGELAHQMLTFSGKWKVKLRPIDLTALIRDHLDGVKTHLAPHSQLALQLAPSLPPFLGDETRIQQMLQSLVINAVEALDGESGEITLSTGVIQACKVAWRLAPYEREPWADVYIYLEVSDTGKGMPTETQERIFDPFYSTKQVGRGMGMAVVQGIVQVHQGYVQVDSEPGQGATVRVYFPAMAAAAPLASVSP